MNLSKAQVQTFWRLWAQAAQAQGWTREAGLNAAAINAKRKEFLARLGFDSLTKVDRTDGFTRVKNELLVLVGTSLKAGLEVNDPTLNKARNYRHLILNELSPCLGVYVADVTGYLTAIMEDKNRWWKIDRPACDITLEDLNAQPIFRRVKGELKEFPSQLEQLVMTLSARLNVLRNKTGDTIHEMKLKAGVPCCCRDCARSSMAAQARAVGQIVPPLTTDEAETTAEVVKAEDPNWTV